MTARGQYGLEVTRREPLDPSSTELRHVDIPKAIDAYATWPNDCPGLVPADPSPPFAPKRQLSTTVALLFEGERSGSAARALCTSRRSRRPLRAVWRRCIAYGSCYADGGPWPAWPWRALLAYGAEHVSRICCGTGLDLDACPQSGACPRKGILRHRARVPGAPGHRDTSPAGFCGDTRGRLLRERPYAAGVPARGRFRDLRRRR